MLQTSGSTLAPKVTRISGPSQGAAVAFSFGTLLTNPEQYEAFRSSFRSAGFSDADCEYLVIDNTSGNTGDGYGGLNAILTAARAETVVLIHQDVVAIDNREALEARLLELGKIDSQWALAGNAGGGGAGEIFIRISDRHGTNMRTGSFPKRVTSLDENFIVVRKSTGARFSADISGFHLYGTDICIVADLLGFNSYVIDFHLKHLGQGKTGADFFKCRDTFRRKWQRALRARDIQTTSTYMYITGSRFFSRLSGPFETIYGRIKRKIGERARLREKAKSSS